MLTVDLTRLGKIRVDIGVEALLLSNVRFLKEESSLFSDSIERNRDCMLLLNPLNVYLDSWFVDLLWALIVSLMFLTCLINEFPALGSFSNTPLTFSLYLLFWSLSSLQFENCSSIRILMNVLVKYSASWNWIFFLFRLVFNLLQSNCAVIPLTCLLLEPHCLNC